MTRASRSWPPSRPVTQLVTWLGLSELAEHTAPEAANHFTPGCTVQMVALGGLASGLACAVFLAPQLKADMTRGSCYGHRYRPEDGDDEKNL